MSELAGSIDHLAGALATQTASISSQRPPEQGSGEEFRLLMTRLADVQKALASRERLYSVGQDMAALCAIASADGVLQGGTKFRAQCPPQNANSEHAYNVATVVVTAEYPNGGWDVGPFASPDEIARLSVSPPIVLPLGTSVPPSNLKDAAPPKTLPEDWELKAWQQYLDKTPERAVQQNELREQWKLKAWSQYLEKTIATTNLNSSADYNQLSNLEVPLKHLAEVLNSTVHGSGMEVTVFGFASATDYSCSKLALQLLASSLRERVCGVEKEATCYRLATDATHKLTVNLKAGEGKEESCTDSKSNNFLSAVRSWSVASLLSSMLDSERWTVRVAPHPFQKGTGKENMQSVVLQIRPGNPK